MSVLKGVARRVLNGELSGLEETLDRLGRELAGRDVTMSQLQESIRLLELALHSQEWQLLTASGREEFTPAGLRMIRELSRVMYLKNPLIGRGVNLQRLYVWALGVSISGRHSRINDVVQAFLDDPQNQVELTAHQARMDKEKDLQLDGNLFFRLFINRQNGRVRLRTIEPDEVTAIICNPEDAKEPWFYGRQFTQKAINGTTETVMEWYPDWRFNPLNRSTLVAQLRELGGGTGRVVWDTPVYHVAVNRHGRWGVSEVYAALDWALAYKRFLEDLATTWRALSRWAATLTIDGGKAASIAAAKAKLNTAIAGTGGETNPPPLTGSVFIGNEQHKLEPFRTAGATMSAEDGRRLALMAIATLGFPETFFGDVSVGTLATAESLDRPTELMIRNRQALWAEVHSNIIGYALMWAVKAPAGPLRSLGRVISEPDGRVVREMVRWNKNVDATVNIVFPPVVDMNLGQYVAAAVQAAGLSGLPADAEQHYLRTFVRLILSAFEVEDAGDLTELIFEEPDPEPEEETEEEGEGDEEAPEAPVETPEPAVDEEAPAVEPEPAPEPEPELPAVDVDEEPDPAADEEEPAGEDEDEEAA